MHDGFQFVKTVRTLAENIEQQVDFAVCQLFQRHERMPIASVEDKSHQNSGRFLMVWSMKKALIPKSERLERIWRRLMRIKNPKTTTRDEGVDVPTREPEVGIGRKRRAFHQGRGITVRINRSWRQIIGEDRIVGRDWRRHDLIDTDT